MNVGGRERSRRVKGVFSLLESELGNWFANEWLGRVLSLSDGGEMGEHIEPILSELRGISLVDNSVEKLEGCVGRGKGYYFWRTSQ